MTVFLRSLMKFVIEKIYIWGAQKDFLRVSCEFPMIGEVRPPLHYVGMNHKLALIWEPTHALSLFKTRKTHRPYIAVIPQIFAALKPPLYSCVRPLRPKWKIIYKQAFQYVYYRQVYLFIAKKHDFFFKLMKLFNDTTLTVTKTSVFNTQVRSFAGTVHIIGEEKS